MIHEVEEEEPKRVVEAKSDGGERISVLIEHMEREEEKRFR
jgi:hypothetical protein